jgi:hypothetical protein
MIRYIADKAREVGVDAKGKRGNKCTALFRLLGSRRSSGTDLICRGKTTKWELKRQMYLGNYRGK